MSRWVRVAIAAALALTGVAAAGTQRAGQITPLSQGFCTPVLSGPGKPQALVVSDLPVSAFPFHQSSIEMQAAIRYVLSRHGFKAGKLTVGYQACNDSNPQQGQGDLTKCAANAKAYAQDASVIGVIGTWSSQCAAVEIPILDTAPGGPLGLVSPTNTNVGLTHAAAGTNPGEPSRYYPSGNRNFVRLISPDDAQGRADALLAQRLGLRRVYVLDDESGYGLDVAAAFRGAARSLGVGTAGVAEWNPAAGRFTALTRRVRASRADGVLLAGSFSPTCAALIRELRSALGRKGVFMGSDGFSPVRAVAQATGVAAENMYVSIPGISPAQLSPLGKEIAHRFGAYHLGSGGPAYAAEAAEVLLDAIARSDGSRASVTRALLLTSIRNGILGTFSFDHNGDTTFNPVLIFRVKHGRGVLDRVLVAPPAAG